MHDLVIKGGNIVDGSGAKAFSADIGIDGGVVTKVGKIDSGRQVIDADGLLVTPGFVDVHTHYDAQVTWDPYLTPSSNHGVTTVVMGNCGVGFAPCAPEKREWLIGLMEGVEDIPGAAMHEGIQWAWESFPEYLDAIEKNKTAIDFATQIPHGALRAYVMKERGAANEDATAEDIQQMHDLVLQGLQAGALGFSTSRTMLHKAIDGRYVPGTFAAKDELFGIGKALGKAGHGVFQCATEHANVPAELDWFDALAQEIGRPVSFNLSQIDQDDTLWQQGLKRLENCSNEGGPVIAQVAGRAIGIIMNWHLTAHPFALHPSFMQVMHESVEERKAVLRNPEFKERLLNEAPLVLGEFETFVTTAYHKMFIVKEHMDYEPSEADSVAAISGRTGKSEKEIIYDALSEDDYNGMLYFPLFNYSEGNLDVLHELHQHPQTRMGLSDAGAHCGAICDGGMPTFMLTHWTRDRSRGAKLELEHVIRRQTSETAELFGLLDRGLIRPGYRADLNLIDYENLQLGRPQIAYDLPAGGRRLLQKARGYRATIANGVIISENDTPTGELPGRLLRGPQSRS